MKTGIHIVLLIHTRIINGCKFFQTSAYKTKDIFEIRGYIGEDSLSIEKAFRQKIITPQDIEEYSIDINTLIGKNIIIDQVYDFIEGRNFTTFKIKK
jgi:hypothetical protein